MKLAKSITVKELVDIEKIRRFTVDELNNLVASPMPLCYQVGPDTLIVGKLKILKRNDKCWSVLNSNTEICEFFMRKNAIVYCIASHRKELAVAIEVRKIDSMLGKLDFDAILYRYRYNMAVSKSNTWDIVLFSNRYEETMSHIAQLKKDLKKLIVCAKYIKEPSVKE